jgi:hypothetical protein
MNTRQNTATCPSCSADVRGNFCSRCGTLARPGTCPQCDSPLQPGDKFCFECGAVVQGPGAAQAAAAGAGIAGTASRGGSAGAAARGPGHKGSRRAVPPDAVPLPASTSRLPWIIGGASVLVILLVFGLRWLGDYREQSAAAIGVRIGDAAPGARVPGEAPAGMGGMGVDPLSLPPEQQADRMFDRIMRLSGEGKTDSVAFFAPMAISVYRQLEPLDLDQRFDLGSVALAARQNSLAREQADAILAVDPDHLLGLVLRIRTARAENDAARERTARERLMAVESAEWAKASDKIEYQRHRGDIEQEIRTIRGR